MPMGPYLVAFSYGSVVFFNTDKELKEAYLAVSRALVIFLSHLHNHYSCSHQALGPCISCAWR